MPHAFALVALSCLVCAGCAPADAQGPRQPASVELAKAEPETPPEPAPLSVVDFVERDAAIFVYLDANELRHSALYRTLLRVAQALPEVRDKLEALTATCGFDPLEAPVSASFSARARAHDLDFNTAVLAVDSSASTAAVFKCLLHWFPQLEQNEFSGRPALTLSDGVVVAHGSFLLVGEAKAAERAIDRAERQVRHRIPSEYLFAELAAPDLFDAERIIVGLGQGTTGSELRVELTAKSVAEAQTLEQHYLEFRKLAQEGFDDRTLDPSILRLASELVESVRVDRRGARLEGSLIFKSPEHEASIMEMLAAVATFGLRRQLASERTSQARATVTRMASQLSSYAQAQKPPRFPKSAKLVPPEVPASASYQSTAQDWEQPGWKDIGFSLDAPQYYAVEFVTAPGARQVTVRALGDLDGDGERARFEMDLRIERGQVVMDSAIREENPLE